MLMGLLVLVSALQRCEDKEKQQLSGDLPFVQYYCHCAATANASLVVSQENKFHVFAPRRSQRVIEFRINS